jgi:hypothetical protein
MLSAGFEPAVPATLVLDRAATGIGSYHLLTKTLSSMYMKRLVWNHCMLYFFNWFFYVITMLFHFVINLEIKQTSL